jgi:release factor glutamine methyltransferase
MSRTDEVSTLGFQITVYRGVFHPSLFFSSRIFGKHLLSCDLRGKSVLDMGTGTGILALCAARAGADVTAVDIHPEAVRCALENVGRNGLTSRVTVLQSDLFRELPPSCRFDLILWNPPFYERPSVDISERAWNAGPAFEEISRFAGDLAGRLAPGGELQMILSSDVDEERFFSAFGNFIRTPVLSRRRFFERLTIYRLVPRT